MKTQRFLLVSLWALFSIHLSAEVTAKAEITIESDEYEVSDQLFLCQDSDPNNLLKMVKLENIINSYHVNLYAVLDEEKYASLKIPSLTNLVVRFVANAHESDYTVTFENVVGDIVLVGENDTIVADTANSYSLKCNPGDTLEFIVNPKPSYERVVEVGKWGTICLPWASNEMYGAEFYEVEALLDSVVSIVPVTELEAGVPYVFLATDSIQKVLYDPETVVTEPINHSGLIGVFDDYVLPDGSWQLVDNQIIYVCHIDYIPANRAYFNLDEMPVVADEGDPTQFLPIVLTKNCGDNDSVDVTPTDTAVTIVFPIVIGAYSYTLIIYADPNFQQVICTVSFNQSGAIITITFAAPERRGIWNEQPDNFTCTVPDLQPATSYYYVMKAMDEGGGVLSSQKGSFTTTGTSTDFDQLTNSPTDRFTKIIKDGQLYILRNGKTYNAQGAEVR